MHLKKELFVSLADVPEIFNPQNGSASYCGLPTNHFSITFLPSSPIQLHLKLHFGDDISLSFAIYHPSDLNLHPFLSGLAHFSSCIISREILILITQFFMYFLTVLIGLSPMCGINVRRGRMNAIMLTKHAEIL